MGDNRCLGRGDIHGLTEHLAISFEGEPRITLIKATEYLNAALLEESDFQ